MQLPFQLLRSPTQSKLALLEPLAPYPVPPVSKPRILSIVRLQGDGDGLEDGVVQVIITTGDCATPASPASALGLVAN